MAACRPDSIIGIRNFVPFPVNRARGLFVKAAAQLEFNGASKTEIERATVHRHESDRKCSAFSGVIANGWVLRERIDFHPFGNTASLRISELLVSQSPPFAHLRKQVGFQMLLPEAGNLIGIAPI